jgi:hypothetical protein
LAHVAAAVFVVAVCGMAGLGRESVGVAWFDLPVSAGASTALTVRVKLPADFRFRPDPEPRGDRGTLLDESGEPLAVVTATAAPDGPPSPGEVRQTPRGPVRVIREIGVGGEAGETVCYSGTWDGHALTVRFQVAAGRADALEPLLWLCVRDVRVRP